MSRCNAYYSVVCSLALVGTFLTLTPRARAGDEDNLNERVSAAACQPRLSADRSKLLFSGSDWTFQSASTGTVTLECPIFSRFADQDTGTRTRNEIRLWYRDSDGTGTSARVQANLRFVSGTTGALTSVLEGSVDSNGSNMTTQTTRATTLGGVTMKDGQYFVVITMFRSASNQIVKFRGVSFFEEP